ncbi:hypothetical protein [Methanolobus sp. WCC4]|uniref:hypothetical protein n=1 Tax=Methanolobus sp. WCC4 TaxID=3125784 RepID=UPI0030F4C5DE
MAENTYSLVINDKNGRKEQIELSRFEMDEKYHRFVRHIAAYLVDKGYEVKSSTDIKNPVQGSRRLFYELSYRSKTTTGLFRKKTEYGKMHTFWVGHDKGKPALNEVIFKIDGKQIAANSALKAVYQMAENRE